MTDFISQISAVRAAAPEKPEAPRSLNEQRARAAAEDFEAVFLAQMLGHMNMGVDPDSAFGGGKGEEAFQSVMADTYGKAIAEMGGVGIADAIYKEILRMQEAAS